MPALGRGLAASVRLAALLMSMVLEVGCMSVFMPGKSHEGPLPPLTLPQQELAAELRRHISRLATDIGERRVGRPAALQASVHYLTAELTAIDADHVETQSFRADHTEVSNLVLEFPGSQRPREIVVIGAHYDSAAGTPAANDNGSAVASLLALAKRCVGRKFDRTVRFVLFVNEEPPYFQTDLMGSLVYARACRDHGDRVVAMLALETMGFYADEPGSQKYPAPFSWFYPDTGNFIGFIGNVGSRRLVRYTVERFRKHARFPSEGAAIPGWITGVGWSDHWSFWQCGFPGVMVTDTAPFRFPYYHTAQDTPDKIDFDRLARVVDGLQPVIDDLATDYRP